MPTSSLPRSPSLLLFSSVPSGIGSCFLPPSPTDRNIIVPHYYFTNSCLCLFGLLLLLCVTSRWRSNILNSNASFARPSTQLRKLYWLYMEMRCQKLCVCVCGNEDCHKVEKKYDSLIPWIILHFISICKHMWISLKEKRKLHHDLKPVVQQEVERERTRNRFSINYRGWDIFSATAKQLTTWMYSTSLISERTFSCTHSSSLSPLITS